MHLVKVFFEIQLLLIFTTVWMILQGLTQIRILNSLMFPKEVRRFHKWKTMLCFYVFLCSLANLDHWIGVYDDSQKN